MNAAVVNDADPQWLGNACGLGITRRRGPIDRIEKPILHLLHDRVPAGIAKQTSKFPVVIKIDVAILQAAQIRREGF